MQQKIINSLKKHHAILVEENSLTDFDYFLNCYAKSIVCEKENGFCDSCIWCRKINEKNYYDLIYVDGFNQKIKKEDILEIISKFSKYSVEDRGIKIYVIKSIENATQQSLNSLLKFLEEPPKDTYAVFSTKNINSVLQTIRSRTQYFSLHGDEKIVDFKLEKYNLTSEEKEIIKKIYTNTSEMEDVLKTKVFHDCLAFSKNLYENRDSIEVIKKSGDEFKKFDYEKIKIILKILMVLSKNNEKIFKLLNELAFNPIKILIYCKLIEAFQWKQS